MDASFISSLFASHQSVVGLPNKETVCRFAEDILEILFPHFSNRTYTTPEEVQSQLHKLSGDFKRILQSVYSYNGPVDDELANKFLNNLPKVYTLLQKDAVAITTEDPAARNVDEVILTYPGFLAIAIYRMAHALYKLGVPYIPRMLTEYAHQKTGIDIHPGAQIGEYFCIDHGTGIVIGQTTIIGNHVKLYQGVTLGAVSVEKTLADTKRHPTIEDHVVIYAGATILGGNVTIGANSIIGGNVWLTENVQPYSKVYHKSQIKVSRQQITEQYLEFYI